MGQCPDFESGPPIFVSADCKFYKAFVPQAVNNPLENPPRVNC